MTVAVTHVFAAVVAAVIGLALSACGGSPGSVSASSAVASTVHNSDDVMFAQHMIPHHQQAIDMAAMVPSHTANPALRVVAIHISTDQRAEISILTDMLNEWGAPTAGPGPMSMEGMVDDATMHRLPSLSGAEFDTVWITAMIGHHQGAVTMAQAELAHGRNPAAKKMARLIINAQQREISYMTDLISTPE